MQQKHQKLSQYAQRYYSYYHESTAGQLPKFSCYEFKVIDRGWRIELDIHSVKCTKNEFGDDEYQDLHTQKKYRRHKKNDNKHYRLSLKLDTPLTK